MGIMKMWIIPLQNFFKYLAAHFPTKIKNYYIDGISTII